MRSLAVVILTICQFTAFPFLAMVSANTTRHQAELVEQADLRNATTIYKTTLAL